MYILKKRDVLFLVCQTPGFIGVNTQTQLFRPQYPNMSSTNLMREKDYAGATRLLQPMPKLQE